MSVLIKGIEMPKSCMDCKLKMAVGCCGNLPHNTRMPHCPLVELPPHGRLIDADALRVDHFAPSSTSNMPNYYHVSKAQIDRAPTIIEAEGGASDENNER